MFSSIYFKTSLSSHVIRLVIACFACCYVVGQEASPPWPEEPKFQSRGAFRAWSSKPNDLAINLERFEGINELKQLSISAYGSMVLTQGGELISFDGSVDTTGILKICRGFGMMRALLSGSGELSVYAGKNPVELEIPSAISGAITDAYVSPYHHAVISDAGEFLVFGKGYNGVKEVGDPEWSIKPELPAGRKAVSMSSSDHSIAVKLDDGSIKIWKSSKGMLDLPAIADLPTAVDFTVNRDQIGFISEVSSRIGIWDLLANKVPELANFPLQEESIGLVDCERGIVGVGASGVVRIDEHTLSLIPELKSVLEKVCIRKLTDFACYVSYSKPHYARLIWFDRPAGSDSVPKPKTAPAKMTGAENEERSEGKVEERVVIPESDLVQSRITGYQNARGSQLLGLAGSYEVMLQNSKEAVQSAGDLNGVLAIQEALEHVSALTAHLKLLVDNRIVQPIHPLPPVKEAFPAELKVLRAKFDTAFAEKELELFSALQKSLDFVQSELVKERELELARQTRDYRKSLVTLFKSVQTGDSTVATSSVVSEMGTKPVATTPSSPKKPDVKPGRLEIWSAKPNEDAARITRARGLSDLVQVYLHKNGWVVLRENGEAVSSERDHDRSGIARITPGWDTAFGMIDEKGTLLQFCTDAAKSKSPVTNVKDAFISETHSIALHRDGTISTWGPAYEGKTEEGIPWEPAPTGLTSIDRVFGNGMCAAAVTVDGSVTAWRSTGECRMGNRLAKNVRDFSARRDGGFRWINETGMMMWWRASDSGSNNFAPWLKKYGPLISVLDTQKANFARTDDGRIITDVGLIERYPELRKALIDLKDHPEDAFSFFTDDEIVRLGWIEPR